MKRALLLPLLMVVSIEVSSTAHAGQLGNAKPTDEGAGQQAIELLTALAGSLSAGDPVGFMRAFDKSMPGYQRLLADVTALTQQADLLSSLEILQDDGDERQRTVTVDWFLQITAKVHSALLERRRRDVKCTLKRAGKRWKVVSLEPLQFFAAPRL